jgi:hypothetical protein
MPEHAPRGARGPFRGVADIVRFNAPVYAAALVVMAGGALGAAMLWSNGEALPAAAAAAAAGVAAALTAGSLGASYVTYDASGLYGFSWLTPLVPAGARVALVHTGLDESSAVLAPRYPGYAVFDASDPALQTEPSIARARALRPLYPGTPTVGVGPLPMPAGSLDVLLVMLAAHEVRDDAARARWFCDLRAAVRPSGLVVVVEHVRDVKHAAAFHVGVLHFLSRRTWLVTFEAAGLRLVRSFPLATFLTVFVLSPAPEAS